MLKKIMIVKEIKTLDEHVVTILEIYPLCVYLSGIYEDKFCIQNILYPKRDNNTRYDSTANKFSHLIINSR